MVHIRFRVLKCFAYNVLLWALSDPPHRLKAAKSGTLLPLSCHPFGWWCTLLTGIVWWSHKVVEDVHTDCCVLKCWGVGWRMRFFRGTYRMFLYVTWWWGLNGELDVQCHYRWGQFSPLLSLAGSKVPSFLKRTWWMFYVGALCFHLSIKTHNHKEGQ